MDRSKWEYKKLGEVCTIERGGSPRPIADYLTDDPLGINWIKIGDAVEGSKYISQTKEKIKPEGMKKSRFVHKGDFILSNSMSFGRPYILQVDGCIHDGWLVLHDNDDVFNKDFLYYYLSSPSTYKTFKKLAVGGVVNNLNSQLVRGVNVSVPPLADQQRIVAELDCLNEMIAVKQEQLKEFDKLAQSIFYDMFGDPIKNERGWETDVIGNVVSEKSYRGSIANIEGKVWLLNLDMVESNTGRVIEKLMVPNDKTDGSVTTFNEDYVLYSKLRPYLNKVVMPDSSGYCTTELVTLLPNKTILNRYYLTSLLRSDSFVDYICGKVAGAKMPRVSMKDFRILYIPLPPLSLQQQFAEKISAIEAQKELVKQSIAETQHLLDYTMDKYFNE